MTIFRHIHEILVGMMTDRDGKTDSFRVLGVIGFLSIIVYMALSLLKGQAFDPVAYAGGLAAYLAGWGTSLLAKGKGE